MKKIKWILLGLLTIVIPWLLLKLWYAGECPVYRLSGLSFEIETEVESSGEWNAVDTLHCHARYVWFLQLDFPKQGEVSTTRGCNYGPENVVKDSILDMELLFHAPSQVVKINDWLASSHLTEEINYRQYPDLYSEGWDFFENLINDGLNGRGDFSRVAFGKSAFVLELKDHPILMENDAVTLKCNLSLKSGEILTFSQRFHVNC